MTIDLDSFVAEVHGYAKQGVAYGYTHERGYRPLLATSEGGEILARADSGLAHGDLRAARAEGIRYSIAVRAAEQRIAAAISAIDEGEWTKLENCLSPASPRSPRPPTAAVG